MGGYWLAPLVTQFERPKGEKEEILLLFLLFLVLLSCFLFLLFALFLLFLLFLLLRSLKSILNFLLSEHTPKVPPVISKEKNEDEKLTQ